MQGQQPALLPIDIQRTEPAPFGSADCTHYGIGFDGLPYLLKRVAPHNPYMPVAELICARMAAASQIACTTGYVTNLPTGEQAFGTRVESGVLTPSQTAAKLLTDLSFLASVAPTLAAIYAFDVFVRNEDRHLGNYLVRQTFAGLDLMAVDHSRALVVTGWPRKLLKLPRCNTTNWQTHLRQLAPFNLANALATVDRMMSLDDDWFSRNICDVPKIWWPAADRLKIERWWIRHRKRRLTRLRRRLKNGTV